MTLEDNTRAFVQENIGAGFHQRRLRKLQKAQLTQLLAHCDPLLLRAQALDGGRTLVRLLLDEHVVKADATLFNDFLKSIAVFVASEVHGGTEPRTDSVDLEFAHEGRDYALIVKPQPAWGSAGQVGKVMDAIRAADAGDRPTDVELLVGCLHGEGTSSPAPHCEKLCGPDLWRFISAQPDFEIRLIEALGADSETHAKKYRRVYKSSLKSLIGEFESEFCDGKGRVRWKALAQFDRAAARAAKSKEEPETEAAEAPTP